MARTTRRTTRRTRRSRTRPHPAGGEQRRVGAMHTAAIAATAALLAASLGGFAAAQQTPTASLRELFAQAHDEFMQKRERYDPMIELRTQYFPHAELRQGTGNFDLLRWVADAELPFPVSK